MVSSPGNIPERVPAPHVTPPARPAEKKPEFKPAPKPELRQAADEVSLSSRAREASSLSSRAKAEPEVRPDRVAEARTKTGKSGGPASDARVAEKLLTEL